MQTQPPEASWPQVRPSLPVVVATMVTVEPLVTVLVTGLPVPAPERTLTTSALTVQAVPPFPVLPVLPEET